jgi:hypothetical protein
MDSKSPEQQLAEFLAAKPSWLRKIFQRHYDFTAEERKDMISANWILVYADAHDEFLELLAQCPDKLRDYRKLQRKIGAETALIGVPSLPSGAPPKDWLKDEAWELHQTGMSHPAVAVELNKRHPDLKDAKGNPRPITAEVVRKHLSAIKKGPEKT